MIKSIWRYLRSTTLVKNYQYPGINAECFYSVVKDCGNYKYFVKNCSDSEIVQWYSENEFDAKLTIDYKVFNDSYVSKVVCSKLMDEEEKSVYKVESFSHSNAMFKCV